MKRKPYCTPKEAGIPSTRRNVAKRIAKLMEALDQFGWPIVDGQIIDDCQNFKFKLINNLRLDGWTVNVSEKDRWFAK